MEIVIKKLGLQAGGEQAPDRGNRGERLRFSDAPGQKRNRPEDLPERLFHYLRALNR
jgi:hypothetical protein